jgi:16S rRNA (guanine966-N2)-methyltransferase
MAMTLSASCNLLRPLVLGLIFLKIVSSFQLLTHGNGGGTLLQKRAALPLYSSTSSDKTQSSSGGGSSSGGKDVPANLRRKVDAKRPQLGHIVPKDARRRQQNYVTGGSTPSKLRQQGVERDPTLNNPGNLRIIGGICKGRKLGSPTSVFLRPMMSKVKAAIFSTLTSFGMFDPSIACRHLDIFAGSGSIGLESLSRGASTCTFVDLSTDCCECIERNLEMCKFQPEQGKVVVADALQALRAPETVGIPAGTTFQILTLGPPYEEVVYADLLDAVANSDLVAEDTIVVIEYPIELGCLPHVLPRNDGGALVGVRNRRYGRTVIAMYIVNPTGVLPVADSRPEEFVNV